MHDLQITQNCILPAQDLYNVDCGYFPQNWQMLEKPQNQSIVISTATSACIGKEK